MKPTPTDKSNATASMRRLSLESLVDELIKAKPGQAFVREKMQDAGLSFSSDTIENMNLVLQALEDLRPLAAVEAAPLEKSRAAEAVPLKKSRSASAADSRAKSAGNSRAESATNTKSTKRKERDHVQDL